MPVLLFSFLLVLTMIHSSSGATVSSPSGVQASSPSAPLSSTTPSEGLPSEGYPLWTPCKDCKHVWYLTCRTPGKHGCIVNGKEVPWSEFVKRANSNAKVVTVEKLRDGTVIVWFKW